jgi:hypothetical protein
MTSIGWNRNLTSGRDERRGFFRHNGIVPSVIRGVFAIRGSQMRDVDIALLHLLLAFERASRVSDLIPPYVSRHSKVQTANETIQLTQDGSISRTAWTWCSQPRPWDSWRR